MGTRSLTYVYEGDIDSKCIVCMYAQFDGYPDGHGASLAEFLLSGKMVNGFGNSPVKEFNGMGCLAAQMVANFKTKVGGFYLYPIDTTDAWQEYNYHIYENKTLVLDGNNKKLFEGTWQEFHKFCSEPQKEEE